MPLPMMHFAVAKNVNDKLSNRDKAQIYLGSISPDSIHARPNLVGKVKKFVTHMRPAWGHDMDNCNWIKNIEYFAKKYSDDDFLMGYCIHLLTDYYWIQSKIHVDFFKAVDALTGGQNPKRNNIYYNETEQIDFRLHQNTPWTDELWQNLSASKPVPVFDLLSAEEVDWWKNHTINWFKMGENTYKEPIIYFKYDDIVAFIDETTCDICKFLREKVGLVNEF